VTDKEHSEDGKWYHGEIYGEYCNEGYDNHDEGVWRMGDKRHSQSDNKYYPERYKCRNELTSGEDKDGNAKADLHFRRHPTPVYG